MKRQAGFTLIEIIAVVVILGVLATVGGFFVISGMKGSLMARSNQEAGVTADMALERIGVELRDANGGPGPGGAITVDSTGPDVSINYTCSSSSGLTGQRTLAFTSATGTLAITPATGETPRPLITGIGSCSMSFSGTTLASTLTVSFVQQSTNQNFSITIKPRGNTVTPVSI